jgi:hypothetical protein
LTLLDDGLFDVVFAPVEELPQFRPDDEERTCHHGPSYLQEQQTGTRVGVGVSRLLERNRKRDALRDREQNEQCAEKMMHSLDPLSECV